MIYKISGNPTRVFLEQEHCYNTNLQTLEVADTIVQQQMHMDHQLQNLRQSIQSPALSQQQAFQQLMMARPNFNFVLANCPQQQLQQRQQLQLEFGSSSGVQQQQQQYTPPIQCQQNLNLLNSMNLPLVPSQNQWAFCHHNQQQQNCGMAVMQPRSTHRNQNPCMQMQQQQAPGPGQSSQMAIQLQHGLLPQQQYQQRTAIPMTMAVQSPQHGCVNNQIRHMCQNSAFFISSNFNHFSNKNLQESHKLIKNNC